MSLSIDAIGRPVPPARAALPGAAPHHVGDDGSLAGMLRARPQMLMAGSRDRGMSSALLYRLLQRRSRLMTRFDHRPSRWNIVQRIAMRRSDGILAGSETIAAMAARLRGSGEAVFCVPGPFDLEAFLELAPTRSGAAARRIGVTGVLSADSDAPRILEAATRWAERHPRQQIELCWLEDGDLHGVLAAQPLPANLSQSFLRTGRGPDLLHQMARLGVIIAGVHDRALSETLAQAMAGGLVVLFDHGDADAWLLQDGRSGIGFDRRQPAGLLQALSVAMAMPEEALDTLRAAARRRARPMDDDVVIEKVERAMAEIRSRIPVPVAPLPARPQAAQALEVM